MHRAVNTKVAGWTMRVASYLTAKVRHRGRGETEGENEAGVEQREDWLAVFRLHLNAKQLAVVCRVKEYLVTNLRNANGNFVVVQHEVQCLLRVVPNRS
jgi:hypothetical protein